MGGAGWNYWDEPLEEGRPGKAGVYWFMSSGKPGEADGVTKLGAIGFYKGLSCSLKKCCFCICYAINTYSLPDTP